MSLQMKKRIFLSASVPLPSRDPAYFNTADVVAIRDAVRALVIVILEQDAQLVFGGHPAISPMIRMQISLAGAPVGDHVVMFQTRFFEREFPEDNKAFERVILTEAVENNREKSLECMRKNMLGGDFAVGIFIGGMEGVETEFSLFRSLQPKCGSYPIASTGAAAANIFNSNVEMKKVLPELMTELSYISLMRQLLQD